MYIWVQGAWEHVNEVLLDAEQEIGTTKLFHVYYGDSSTTPDISSMKPLNFWDWNTTQRGWRNVDVVKRLHESKKGNDTVTAMGVVQYGNERHQLAVIKLFRPRK